MGSKRQARQKRMPLEMWLSAEKFDEANRSPLPYLLKVRKGATRRDANIEEINFEGPLVCVTLKWNDAREGEKETYGHRMARDKFAEMLRQLGVNDEGEFEYRRVLVDFWTGKDGEESRGGAIPRRVERQSPSRNDDNNAICSLHWKEAA
jgi:hypothetical protein